MMVMMVMTMIGDVWCIVVHLHDPILFLACSFLVEVVVGGKKKLELKMLSSEKLFRETFDIENCALSQQKLIKNKNKTLQTNARKWMVLVSSSSH